MEGASDRKGEAALTNLLRHWHLQILRMGFSGVSVPVQHGTPSPRPTQQGFPGALQGFMVLAPAHECSLWKRGRSQAPAWELYPAAQAFLRRRGDEVRRWVSHTVSAESADSGQNTRIFTCCGNPLLAVPGLSFSSVVRPQSLRVGLWESKAVLLETPLPRWVSGPV